MFKCIDPNVPEIQKLCLERIFLAKQAVPVCSNPHIEEILTYTEQDFKNTFGANGGNFYQVFLNIDFDHPETHTVISESVTSQVLQALKLMKLIESNEYNDIKPFITKCFFKYILRDNGSLIKENPNYARLFKELLVRNQARHLEQSRTMPGSLKSVFFESSLSVKHLIREENFFERQLELHRKRIEVYERQNLSAIVDALKAHESSFTESFGEPLYGFQRVSLSILSVLLAKLHGCVHVGEKIMYNTWEFKPKLYPYHEFQYSEKMDKIINHLEAFPELHNKPLFDSYYVLAPGRGKEYWNQQEIHEIDVESTPFLIGARKELKQIKYYFVSFWEF